MTSFFIVESGYDLDKSKALLQKRVKWREIIGKISGKGSLEGVKQNTGTFVMELNSLK
jgi:hypothetical protein